MKKPHRFQLRAGLFALPLALGCGDFTPAQTPPVGDAGPTFNTCPASAFTDRSADSAARTVSFGGLNGSPPFNYAPRCIRIAAGQSVTFMGTFVAHPLSPGVSPSNLTAGTAGSPITRTSGSSSASFTFNTPGVYPYFCEQHFNAGMSGVVLVQ